MKRRFPPNHSSGGRLHFSALHARPLKEHHSPMPFASLRRAPTRPSSSPASSPNLVLGLILAAYLMIVLDVSVIITALPEIHTALHFSSSGLSWVQNAYALTF